MMIITDFNSDDVVDGHSEENSNRDQIKSIGNDENNENENIENNENQKQNRVNVLNGIESDIQKNIQVTSISNLEEFENLDEQTSSASGAILPSDQKSITSTSDTNDQFECWYNDKFKNSEDSEEDLVCWNLATVNKSFPYTDNKDLNWYKSYIGINEPLPVKNRDNISERDQLKFPLRCGECSQIFQPNEKHGKGQKWNNVEIRCDMCGKTFTDFESKKQHNTIYGLASSSELHHAPVESNFLNVSQNNCKVDNLHKCRICNQQFQDNSELNVHMTVHNDIEFQELCDLCTAKNVLKKALQIRDLHLICGKVVCKSCDTDMLKPIELNLTLTSCLTNNVDKDTKTD